MSNLIVDSSVAVKWFVPEPYSSEARRILDGFQNGSLTLRAPELIVAEFGNIIWKKHLFQGLAEADAQSVMNNFRALPFDLTPTADLIDDAYQLAVAHRRTVYDSLYLALSVRESCQFVTADEKLANAVGSAFPNVVWLANWP